MNRSSALVIDDNEIDRYILLRHLKQCDVDTIKECVDGSCALTFLKDYNVNEEVYGDKFPPNVIFLDINMPNVDGFQFLESIAGLMKEEAYAGCSVIMCSSSDRPEDRKRASAYEFVKDYIVKGETTPEQLKDKVLSVTGLQ